MRPRRTKDDFVKLAIAATNGRYDYSKTVYVNARTPVVVTCPAHGDFTVTPYHHTNGALCKLCAMEELSRRFTSSTEEFVRKAIALHGDKYLYGNVAYTSSSSKVNITCRKHGDFPQTPNSHLNGSGCPKCKNEKLSALKIKSNSDFIAEAKIAHGDRYGYEKTLYTGDQKPVVITCKVHGDFEQDPRSHALGFGCSKCGHLITAEKTKCGTEEFVRLAVETHGDTYDYTDTVCNGIMQPLSISCRTHGPYRQLAKLHITGSGCPKCAAARQSSAGEKELAEYIRELGFTAEGNVRGLLADQRKEIDILVTAKGLAIEFNGNYYHSEAGGKGRSYHKDKLEDMQAAVGSALMIRDDLFREKPDLIKSVLAARLGVAMPVVAARKCDVLVLESEAVRDFLDNNHVQGKKTSAFLHLGLAYAGELVSVAAFSKNKAGETELSRFCSIRWHRVTGALGRLMSAWDNEVGGPVVTFCDKQLFTGKAYEAAGFARTAEVPPSYHYTNGKQVLNKELFRRNKAEKLVGSFSDSDTERQYAERAGWYRLWDCGKIRFDRA